MNHIRMKLHPEDGSVLSHHYCGGGIIRPGDGDKTRRGLHHAIRMAHPDLKGAFIEPVKEVGIIRDAKPGMPVLPVLGLQDLPLQHSDTRSDVSSRRGRRGTILGVSAGVLGGGLVGLAMTLPSFTSAATDTTTDTTTDPAADTVVVESDERPEAGTRLRETLQALVDEGTITAEQADAVTEHLVENRPEREGRGHRGGHPGMDGDVVAELIGIDAAELRTEIRSGRSIADIAEANGVDVQIVIDALVEEAQGHLDLAVENGRLTEDEAAEKQADLTERITARVNGERPTRD